MTETTMGNGIESVDEPDKSPDVAIFESMPAGLPENVDVFALVEDIKAGLRHEMDAAIADIERRLGQAREIERSIETGVPRETMHAEDLNVGFAMIDGYNLTANSPSAGHIAWSSLFVVLLGVTYTITNASTSLKYAWFVKPGSYTPGTPMALQTSDTMPTLGAGDALIFINNGGVPISVLESSVVYAVGPGVIGQAQLDTTTTQLLANLQAADLAQQARIDGVITSYYQNDPPWPAGAASPSGGDVNMGDIWYDANDGGAFRWTGASGSPANAWQKIADTDTSAIAAKVNTKTSTYLSVLATPPTPPTGGFTTGDFWMVTDQGNLIKRWSGSAWVDLQMGDAAISAVSGTKIGTGINGTNITTGTIGGARIGTGVAPSVLTGSGTAPVAAIPQLTPAKLNTAFHMLL